MERVPATCRIALQQRGRWYSEYSCRTMAAGNHPEGLAALAHGGGLAQSGGLASLASLDSEGLRKRIEEGKEREREQHLEEAAREAKVAAALQAAKEAVAAGKAAFASGDFAEAEKQFDIALESSIDNRHEIVCNRAACALKLGRFSDAVADASEATYLEPNYLKGYYRLAQALQGVGKIDRALIAVRNGLKLQPDSKQLLSLLAELEAAEKAAAGSDPPKTEAAAGNAAKPRGTSTGGGSASRRAQIDAELAKLMIERHQAEQSATAAAAPAAVDVS